MTLSASTDDLYKRYYGDQQPAPATAPAAERSFLQDLAVKATQSALSFPEGLFSKARSFVPEAPGITERVLPYVEKAVGSEGKIPATGLPGFATSGLAMFADPTLYVGGVGGLKGLGTALASTLAGEGARQLGGGVGAQMGASASVPLLLSAISFFASKRGLNKAAQQALKAGASAEEVLANMTAYEKAELQELISTDPEGQLARALERESLAVERQAQAGLQPQQIPDPDGRLAKAADQETEIALQLQNLPSQFVLAPSTSLENLGEVLQQTSATKPAGQIISSAAQRVAKSAAKSGQQLIVNLKSRLGLAGVNGYKAIPIDTMAARARKALQSAREAAYQPLSKEYKAWDSQYGNMQIPVSGDTLSDLINQTREMYTVMGGNVRGALERGTHSAMGTSLNRLEQGLATIGADNLVDVSVRDLRNVQKAIHQKTALTMPGDASRMLFFIDDQIENLLMRGLSGDPSAMKKLQQINSQYANFKQTFDRNPSLRPLLNPRSREVASFRAILNEDGILAYQNALGKNASHELGYFMLQNELGGTPQKVLSDLENNRALQLALGNRYDEIVQQVQRAGKAVDARDLTLAYQELLKAKQTPGLPSSVRDAIEIEQKTIERQIAGTAFEKRVNQLAKIDRERQQVLAEAKTADAKLLADREAAQSAAARELAEATAAREAAQTTVEKVAAGSLSEKLRREVSEARTPAQMKSVLNRAKKMGAQQAEAVADLFLERLISTASREPIEFVQQIAQNREIWLPLMGASNQSAFQRLAKNFDQLERSLAAATKTQTFQNFITRSPQGAKASTLSGAVRLLTRVSGLQWLARTAIRGTPISRTIDSLLSGTPESKARTLIALLRESGPNSLLQAARAFARSDTDTTDSDADAGEPLSPELQQIYDRIYGNVFSR